MTSQSSDDLEARITRLEAAVFASGRPDDHADSSDDDGAERTTSGILEYSGAVDFTGPVTWNITYSANAAVDLAPEALSSTFAALGHPARIEIVRLLIRGNASVTDLQEAGDFGTTGQLYHHLKILTTASIVTKVGRNDYGIAPTHLVPVLVSMLAAGDISGLL